MTTARERQENEFEVIESIFGNDVEDLRLKREKNDGPGGWRPLHLRLHLTPLQGSFAITEKYVRISMHLICSSKYPKVPPKVSLENAKGLADALVEQLQKQLNAQVESLRGQEMIYELAQTVQTFLHEHNKPPPPSFYEEMLAQKTQRDQERLQCQRMRENLEQQAFKDEIEKRKEMLKKESRIRRDTRSLSESSPQHRRSTSASVDFDKEVVAINGWPYYRSHLNPNECLEHRQSEKMYFNQSGRKVQRGSCLGHSQKGCIAYSGIDLESGQLLYITEWAVRYEDLEQMCLLMCSQNQRVNGSGDGRCMLHSPDEVILTIERQMATLNPLRHKNLVNYECVWCLKKKDHLLIYLVQDFVLGTSVSSISASLGWCVEGVAMVAKGVLDAIIYLHNNSVFHNQLVDTNVLIDNTGTVRVTDYLLVPYLQEMTGNAKVTKGDLPALGDLIEVLPATPSSKMRDFIDSCKSDRILTSVELLDHLFLQTTIGARTDKLVSKIEGIVDTENENKQVERRSFGQKSDMGPNTSTTQSRLENEFEFLQFLGKGAYGDVLKVRNILDNRQYAIKRIPLTARNKQLYKKIRREVELLSRLNHENVVRYYNSWIEVGLPSTDYGQSEMTTGDFSISSPKQQSGDESSTEDADSSSDDDEEDSCDWISCIPPAKVPSAAGAGNDDSSDGGIEFVNSDGECASTDNILDEVSNISLDNRRGHSEKRLKSPRWDNHYMYIQMEFCEKSTLRTVIDSGLYADKERLWRLFREIAEGLAHIHQQGMIHRDLKPVNIFLDSRDQVKIGDFGLATTSFLALQNQEHHNASIMSSQTDAGGDTLTGHVGTALYVAPELNGNAYKATYNNKVDLYSLGIMLFEMTVPPFDTAMERVATIHALRTPEIKFPPPVANDANIQQNVQVIKWLLNHDPVQRPSSEELLASDLIPPPHLEATELQEMLRNVLANPQSKTYKHLVSRCLSQHNNDRILELTYHLGLAINSTALEYVRHKVVQLLRLHGAIEVVTPLLMPLELNHSHHNSVKLMTHSGCVVYLPYDFRSSFAMHVAINGITTMRRYTVGRVFREKKVFNFHPKQLYECAFDIINQNPGNLLADAEVLAIAYRISAEFPPLKDKNVVIRINHRSLLRAILIHCNVPKDKHGQLFIIIVEFTESKLSRYQMVAAINVLLSTKGNSTNTLIELLLTESPLGMRRNNVVVGNAMRSLLRGRGEAATLANEAFREMEHVAQLALEMGVKCPIVVHVGIMAIFDRTRSGIVWQLVADLKLGKRRGPDILAVGGRYDELLSDFQRMAAKSGTISVPEKKLCGVGFSFALDKLVYSLGSVFGIDYRAIDVLVCVTGAKPPLQDVTQILRHLWSLKIRNGVLEAHSIHDAEVVAKELGAGHVIILGENGALRVSTWENRIFKDQQVTRPELMEYLSKLKSINDEQHLAMVHYNWNNGGNNDNDNGNNSGYNYSNNNYNNPSMGSGGGGSNSRSSHDFGMARDQSYSTKSNAAAAAIHNIEIIFMVSDKLVSNTRKRLENQILQVMRDALSLFNKRERIKVYAIEMTMAAVGAFVGAIDKREVQLKKMDQSKSELLRVVERFPRFKKAIYTLHEDILEDLIDDTAAATVAIIGLYSIPDNGYRFII